MVRASAGEVATGSINGIEVIVVGPDSQYGSYLEVSEGSMDVSFDITDGGYSLSVEGSSGGSGTYSYYCRWNFCNYGAKVDWEEKQVTLSGEDPIDFYGDRVAFVGRGGNLPSNWDSVELGPPEISYSMLSDIPNSLCSGASTQVEVGISQNQGLESVSGTIELVNNISEDIQSESFSVDTEAGTKRTFTFKVPDDTSSFEADPITLRVKGDADNTPIEEDIGISIGANPSDLDVGGISVSKSGSLCVGSRINPTISVTNNSNCEAPVTAEISNSVNSGSEEDSDSISSGSTSDFSFRRKVPQEAPQGGTLTYQIAISSQGTEVATKTLDVDVGKANLNLVSTNGPTSICTGSGFTLEAEAVNNGSCEGRGRLKITNSDTGLSDIVVSESVRVGSSLDFRLDRTVPDSLSSLDKTTYTIELQEYSEGEYVPKSSEDIEVEVDSPSISLNTVNVTDSVCPGQSFTVNTQYSNEGGCEGRARIQATNVLTGETQNSSPETVRTSYGSSANFTLSLPTDDELGDQFKVQITAQVPGPEGSWEGIETIEKTIDIGDWNLVLNSVNAPDSACAGEEISIPVEVRNDGACPANTRTVLNNLEDGSSSTSESKEIGSGSEEQFEVQTTIPTSALESGEAEVELLFEYGDAGGFTQFATETLSIEALTFDLSVTDVSAPSEACIDSDISVEVTADNQGGCPANADIEIVNQDVSESVVLEDVTITPGSEVNPSASIRLSPELRDVESTSYEVTILGDRGGSLIEEDTQTVDVSVNKPQFNLKTLPYPEFQKPGGREANINVENTGDCEGQVVVNVADETLQATVPVGEEATLTHSYNVPIEGTSFSLSVINTRTDSDVVSRDVNITPHQYVHLKTDSGTLEIVGGFGSDNRYRGVINGTGVEGGDNLEEGDQVNFAVSTGYIRGTAGTDSEDIDTVTFDSVQYLSLGTQTPAVWVVNGDIKEEARSMKFNTPLSNSLGLGEGLDVVDETDISVTGGVTTNVGVLRRKVGLSNTPLGIKTLRRLR